MLQQRQATARYLRKNWDGGLLVSCITVVLRILARACLCQDGARRVLTDQAGITRTKRRMGGKIWATRPRTPFILLLTESDQS